MNQAAAAGIGMTSQRTRARMVDRLREQGVSDPRVLHAMGVVPRHLFIEAALAHRAYDDSALPLGFAQTISQPYVVARMIELLIAGRELGKTLEVGAGCGYQAAVLGVLSKQVFAVERIAPLLMKARENLKLAKLTHIRLKHADGNIGLREAAPFDSIILAAAPTIIPVPLLEQLALGGRMILPLGGSDQILCLIERTATGFVETRFDAVRFVPLLPGVE
ncbi:MAG: protein-L-isoaspartate(D-aspartate) O-methyltransferase [Rhodocyclaceae bacterium]|nr:protein-L-isoaspartate(D-aspartate) O-methyltransferase [Rhodocyclaceae bacterium]MBP7079762.1 protein-L-isoaspartate(D-aspartate) O-methyltransferase [Rhodocyclaceae bacterium]